MPFTEDELKTKQIERREVDGRLTYFVDGQPYCLGKGTCKNPAGKFTDHFGSGRCKFHGGFAGRPPKPKGEKAIQTKKDLTLVYQAFLEDPEPLSVHREMAILNSLIERQWFDYQTDPDPKAGIALNEAIDSLIDLALKQTRIESRYIVPEKALKFQMLNSVNLVQKLFTQWFDPNIQEARLENFLDTWQALTDAWPEIDFEHLLAIQRTLALAMLNDSPDDVPKINNSIAKNILKIQKIRFDNSGWTAQQLQHFRAKGEEAAEILFGQWFGENKEEYLREFIALWRSILSP